MNLNSDNVKCGLMSLYWPICLYWSKAFCHAASLRGGNAPSNGFHSVMESPEPVSRVIPPRITCTMIMPTPVSSQMATGFEERGAPFEFIGGKGNAGL